MLNEYEELTERVIGAAIDVHRALGPGLLESAYEACLAAELTLRGIRFARQVAMPVVYKGITVDCGYRMDFVIEDVLVVELKAVERLTAIHDIQLVSYLRLSGLRVGLLMNFHELQLVNGVRRKVNG